MHDAGHEGRAATRRPTVPGVPGGDPADPARQRALLLGFVSAARWPPPTADSITVTSTTGRRRPSWSSSARCWPSADPAAQPLQRATRIPTARSAGRGGQRRHAAGRTARGTRWSQRLIERGQRQRTADHHRPGVAVALVVIPASRGSPRAADGRPYSLDGEVGRTGPPCPAPRTSRTSRCSLTPPTLSAPALRMSVAHSPGSGHAVGRGSPIKRGRV